MTFEAVSKIVCETLNCEAEQVKLEASLSDDLGADSLDAVDLGMALEDEFGLSIPDEELGNFKTIADIVQYIDANKK